MTDEQAATFIECGERCKIDAHLMAASSLSSYGQHRAYRDIVGLGRDAIPSILQEIAFEPEWFWSMALMEITGANPALPEDADDLAKVSAAWLRWGATHELLPAA
jgi:hypothetical protein